MAFPLGPVSHVQKMSLYQVIQAYKISLRLNYKIIIVKVPFSKGFTKKITGQNNSIFHMSILETMEISFSKGKIIKM